MVVIRLSRTGAKKSPFYHVVVTDSRSARDSNYIERIGYYNPLARGKATLLELNQERISHWVKTGAQLSPRVSYLLKNYDGAALKLKVSAAKTAKKERMKAKKAKAAAPAEATTAETAVSAE